MPEGCRIPVRKSSLVFAMFFLAITVFGVETSLSDPPIGTFYYPPGNMPPGPPPNYNQVDTIYFMGTPVIPMPPPDSGGIYIWVDSTGWNIANHIYSQGFSLEQFHGSVLAMLDSPPTPGVNVFANGFEIFGDTTANRCYLQNDRWGWYQWSENLYEIWWDVSTREWKQGSGDPNDFMVINIAGCAIDFNVWSSGHGGGPFDTDQIYLGGNMVPLSSVPGFVDTYPGVSDPYQSQAGPDPTVDPNITIFTAKIIILTYHKISRIPLKRTAVLNFELLFIFRSLSLCSPLFNLLVFLNIQNYLLILNIYLSFINNYLSLIRILILIQKSGQTFRQSDGGCAKPFHNPTPASTRLMHSGKE